MITKHDLTKAVIKEYDKLINIYSHYLSKVDYSSDQELHAQQGRVDAFKECILGQQEKKK